MKATKPPKPPKPITFRHRYYKLDLARAGQPFTTIRGKAQFAQLTVGQHIPIETPDGNFIAVIRDLSLCRVSAMPLAFLKADAEFPGNTISERMHFVRLLNSFRSPTWTQVTLDSELTVITLQASLCHTCRKLITPGATDCPHCLATDTDT